MLLPVSLLFLAAAARQTAGRGQEGPNTARRALANGGEQPEGIVP
jgi:hypothetical protein